MKPYLPFIFFGLLACLSGKETITFPFKNNIQTSNPKVDKTGCDTITVNNKRFVACNTTDIGFYITNSVGDTIYKNEESPNAVEKIDFNFDGYTDFLLGYIDIYSSYELILFDKNKDTFRAVEGFENCPNPLPIEGTKYYYSYTHNGCADSNWISSLFYIQNFKVHTIGIIQGIGCEEEKKNGIFISKINKDSTETLIKSIPRKPGYYEGKFDFINEYWAKNYKLFEK